MDDESELNDVDKYILRTFSLWISVAVGMGVAILVTVALMLG